NYVKYHGKTAAKFENFQKRKDKFFFEKLARHNDLELFLIANFLYDSKTFPQKLNSKEAQKIYLKYKKNIDSLSYNFEQDLNKLDSNLRKNLVCEKSKGCHPILFVLYVTNSISIQTLVIILITTKYLEKWDEEFLKEDFLWKNERQKIIKYISLFEFDEAKFKKILVKNFKEKSNV